MAGFIIAGVCFASMSMCAWARVCVSVCHRVCVCVCACVFTCVFMCVRRPPCSFNRLPKLAAKLGLIAPCLPLCALCHEVYVCVCVRVC